MAMLYMYWPYSHSSMRMWKMLVALIGLKTVSARLVGSEWRKRPDSEKEWEMKESREVFTELVSHFFDSNYRVYKVKSCRFVFLNDFEIGPRNCAHLSGFAPVCWPINSILAGRAVPVWEACAAGIKLGQGLARVSGGMRLAVIICFRSIGTAWRGH